jgi:methionyl-tRNA formyltransferase
VVTQPDRPGGRGLKLLESPIKRQASAAGLPIFQPERIRDPEAVRRINELSPDALVVVAYGQIVPRSLLDAPRFGAINLHASLLPRHRGPAPIAWAILSGDSETGVTVIQMDAGVDTGPMLVQERVPIRWDETASTLEERLSEIGARVLLRTLEQLERGEVTPVPQPNEGATHAPRLQSEDGRLSNEMSATEIDRRVRALTPAPGCWVNLRGREVKVLRGHIDGDQAHGISFATRDANYVIDEIQPPGGRPMAAEAWERGLR